MSSIYLNPVKDYFFIDAENNATITLYDILGKEVLFHNASGTTKINMDHLLDGIYSILIILSDGIIGKTKIVNQ
ncbi:MAG: T9SS type A sorting domain-containing protein [Bacteroidales bacterium]|nr:T9SS type A sorting domain-containing protein [Bacteroidales bacterium]